MKFPSDFLLISFFLRTVHYRIRFKVMQRPLAIQKVYVLFCGDHFYAGRLSKRNVIYVNTSISKQEFEETVRETIRKRYELENSEISLKFEKGNKIKFKEV